MIVVWTGLPLTNSTSTELKWRFRCWHIAKFSALQNSVAVGAWRTSSKPSLRSIWLKLQT